MHPNICISLPPIIRPKTSPKTDRASWSIYSWCTCN